MKKPSLVVTEIELKYKFSKSERCLLIMNMNILER